MRTKVKDFFQSLSDRFANIPKKVRQLSLVLLLIGLIILPFLSSSVYYRHMLITALIYIVLTLSLNLIMGMTGQLALGHAAFYGIGSYTFTLLIQLTPTPYWIAFIAGGVMSAILAGFLGGIVLRLKGHYLAIVTLAFNEIVRVVLYNWVGVTRGPMGLGDIPRPSIFGFVFNTLPANYYLILVIAVITFVVFHNLMNSRHGRAFISIREEEIASIAMGVRTTRLKVLSFVVGCFFAGLAGSFLASYIRYIHPDNFTVWGSLVLNAMVVVGGEGSMIGSVLGAVLLTVVPEALRFAEQFRMIFYAIVLIAAIIIYPYGLAGKPKPPKDKDEEHTPKEEAEQALTGIDIDESENEKSPGGESEEILTISGLTMAFGGLIAVNNLDLSVTKRHIHSIIGPNGAGKTTFFNVISGFYKPKSGSILFDGHEVLGLKPNEISRLGMARTFQKIRLFGWMTAIDNVLVACDSRMTTNVMDSIIRTPKLMREEKEMRQRALELLDFIGLYDKRNQFANSLPYGDQRRLEIARALATNVKLLILDEPTAGMSSEETSDVIHLINLLREVKGLTILLIEHDMKVVMGISDRISVLDHGNKIAEGIPFDIQNNPQVIEAYLGTETVESL